MSNIAYLVTPYLCLVIAICGFYIAIAHMDLVFKRLLKQPKEDKDV